MTGNWDAKTGILPGRKPCDDGGSGWSDVHINQGLLAEARSQEKARKDTPLEPSERVAPCQHTDLGLLVPRTVREMCCFKPLSSWFFVTAATGN